MVKQPVWRGKKQKEGGSCYERGQEQEELNVQEEEDKEEEVQEEKGEEKQEVQED